ncbi:glutaryl- dehydrogenase [Trichoderma arundinaceum]|uniref:Glutaryl-dehydrogenase n=1 Tax=Trichoderma arundinaceum TaxID=490622 RepID=A0A395NH11_TRIAR|nr:glutaryl- dehydrogenase [Trichoderma arundinaceum]
MNDNSNESHESLAPSPSRLFPLPSHALSAGGRDDTGWEAGSTTIVGVVLALSPPRHRVFANASPSVFAAGGRGSLQGLSGTQKPHNLSCRGFRMEERGDEGREGHWSGTALLTLGALDKALLWEKGSKPINCSENHDGHRRAGQAGAFARSAALARPIAARSYATGAAAGPTFDWQDPLNAKNLFTEEELAIAETAERYCQERLQPRVLQAYRDEHYDPKILEEMGELGLLGSGIKGYGCAGVSSVAGGLITRAVERVDSGYRSGMSVQSSLVMGGIYEFGTEEQKERFLPEMARGKLIGAFGLTEPNHGSDPGSMESVAKPHPTKKGYYSLSGAKTWITNSPIADVLLIWAKLQETGKIRGFLIERKDCPPGTLETPAIKDKNGLRASITGMIQMDEVPVPEANMFPDVEGLKGPFSCLNSARYGISLGVMGALEDAIARARTYSLERKQFKGNPLARYQLIQKKLADAATDAAYGTLAAVQVGRLKDEGKVTPEMISMVKRQNCDAALRNVRVLQEVFGGNAVSDEYHIGRHVANLFVTQTYEGQSDIHTPPGTLGHRKQSHPEQNVRAPAPIIRDSIAIRGVDEIVVERKVPREVEILQTKRYRSWGTDGPSSCCDKLYTGRLML